MGGKGYKGVGMEGPIARWYATGTGKDLARYEEQAGLVAEHAPAGARILEVAPGPGYLSIELARNGYTVTGLDVSATFVEIARENAADAGVHADFREGNASAMPFEDGAFDFIVCCAAFKNFSDPVDALREMRRVLAPGGTALIVDLRPDVSAEAVNDDVTRMGLGVVRGAITKFTLRSWLAKRAYTRESFEELIARTDFASSDIRETPMSLEVALHR